MGDRTNGILEAAAARFVTVRLSSFVDGLSQPSIGAVQQQVRELAESALSLWAEIESREYLEWFSESEKHAREMDIRDDFVEGLRQKLVAGLRSDIDSLHELANEFRLTESTSVSRVHEAIDTFAEGQASLWAEFVVTMESEVADPLEYFAVKTLYGIETRMDLFAGPLET